MAKPLLLPGFAKRAARAVRDTPATNNFITSGLRPIFKRFPADAKAALAAHFPRVGTVTTRLPGGQRMRLASSEPEGVLNSIFYGSWVGAEPEVLPLWYALCQQASTIVDIGAHIGHFTLVGGLANPSARVFSFEPLPRIAALLKQNVELNRLANVSVQAKALGREAGTLPFYAVPGGLPSSSSLSKEFMSDGFGEIVEIPVEVSTLDFEHIPTNGQWS